MAATLSEAPPRPSCEGASAQPGTLAVRYRLRLNMTPPLTGSEYGPTITKSPGHGKPGGPTCSPHMEHWMTTLTADPTAAPVSTEKDASKLRRPPSPGLPPGPMGTKATNVVAVHVPVPTTL